MLCFNEGIKSITREGITVLYNLANNHFIKIRAESMDFLTKYIAGNGNRKELIKSLNKDDSGKFKSLISYLREKKYIIDDSLKAAAVKKDAKQRFLEQKRGAYYEVTHYCNLKCRFCYANPNFRPVKVEGDLELSKKIIDKAGQLNITHLVISGGEPLLRKDVFAVLEYAKERMDKVILATNGILIDKITAQKLKDTGIDEVSISLESSSREVHDHLRGQGTYAKIMSAIDFLKGAGFDKNSLNIAATVSRQNIHTIHELPQFAEDLGVKMNYSMFQPVGRGKGHDELAITTEQFFELTLKLKEGHIKELIKSNEDIDFHLLNNPQDGKLVPFLKSGCGIVEKTLGIKFNGDVVPCHLFFSVTDANILIGNIMEEAISDKLWQFYVANIPEVDEKEGCRDCHVRYFCGSSCFAAGYFKDGTFATPHPFCRRFKLYYSELLDCLGKEQEVGAFRRSIEKYLSTAKAGEFKMTREGKHEI